MPASSNSVAQARLREALNAGGPGTKEKGPPVADGSLTVTPDTPEAIEFRSRRSVIDSLGASSSGYLEDETGPKPSELYGKFTWKIDNFSEIGKRELRSTIFEVGSYKWYILVYPQGCDVCNHLSLFLCVADYDKLLPGWSHFAQFTIAVVNKDPKKSKYSDTLHRFCKKEHDWGWKKFMELNKVLEGFTVNNTLVIKAQVQVIRDRPHMPFRCLDAQYRRELVRVYLTNVETICRKFVDEKRAALVTLREDSQGFRAFLGSLDPARRRKLAKENGEVVLKGVVKRFFNEKEVTSTLVMDALFSGCKQLEEAGKNSETKKGKKERPGAVINAGKHIFSFTGDMGALLDRAATESIPLFREDKATDSLSLRNAQDVDDYSRDYVERDERRLAELGRRAVEMFAVSHIFSELQGAYGEAESIKLQDALIKEEEEAERLEDQRQASRLAAEREKKARKKERRRAKKEADDAQEAERKKEDAVDAAESASDTSSKPRLETQTSSGRSQTHVPSPAASQPSSQPSQSTSLPEAAARTSARAETTGRAAGAEGEARSGQRTARSSAEGSDDEASSTSRSGNDEKPTVTTKQFEDHIEYLKGELARATSQLNATRSELVSSEEALAAARMEVGQLREELRAAKAEGQGRGAGPRAEPQQDASLPSIASSFSGLNVAEAASMVSSADAECPSRGESTELAGEAGRSGSLHDSGDAISTGEASSGSGQPHHSRRAAWNGGQGAAHQDPHAPATSGHLHHPHPHLGNARSKSGQLPGIRPPPPPPSDPRTGATPRGGSMPRQGSGPAPKEGPRHHQQRPSQQQQGWAGNGSHPPGKRAEPQSRAASKAKPALNGNAPSFVPGSTAQPQPPPPPPHSHPLQGNGGPMNGHHPVSYRNAAAGLLAASGSGEAIEQPPPPPPPPSGSASAGLVGKAPSQIATGKGGRGVGSQNPSMPATPRSADQSTPAAPFANGSMDESFSPTAYGLPSQQATPFTPHDGKKAEHNGPTESPGLDDFAHMGLINDLLE